VLSAVVVVGMYTVRRHPALRWILAAHAATAFLYVLTAAVNRPDTRIFTGYWYNDSHRLAAMLPITGVPLAVAGILFLAGKIATAVTAEGPSGRRRLAGVPGLARTGVVAVGLTLVLVLATGGLYPDDRYARVAAGYDPQGSEQILVTDQMREFFDRAAKKIPEDAVVVGNPFEGSALLWALEGRKVLFPHFRTTTKEAHDVIAQHLDELMTDPAVCDAVNRLKVDYLLIGGAEFRTRANRWKYFTGLSDPVGREGFELVDSSGPSKLYKITGCDGTVDRPAG
jgi:hypothetical protein